MLSQYFIAKTKTSDFQERIETLISKLQGRKVLIYGAGEGFEHLNKTYNFPQKIDIVAIADKKFECCETEKLYGIKTIAPSKIKDEKFDVILVSNEFSLPIVNYLINDLCFSEDIIETLFVEDIKDERTNLNYLYKHKFDKTLPKLVKKLKGKKIVLYGAGVYLELIKKYFDISDLNILGISDKRFEIYNSEKEFLGYKTIAPSEIERIKPDYVLVSTKKYIKIIEDLYYETLKGSKIKIKPLVKKTFFTLIKEVWNL